MERSVRKKAPSKKAAALEAIAGIRNGERRRVDDVHVLEDDVYDIVPDDGSTARDASGTEDCEDVRVPGKRSAEGLHGKRKKLKAPVDMREQIRMQTMFSKASEKRTNDEDDGMLEMMLSDMDKPAAASPVARGPTAGRTSMQRARQAIGKLSTPPSSRVSLHRPAKVTPSIQSLDVAESPPQEHDETARCDEDDAPLDEPQIEEDLLKPTPEAEELKSDEADVPAAQRTFKHEDIIEQMPGPASGWQHAHTGQQEDEAEPTIVEASDGCQDEDTAAMDCDDASAIQFFYIDAHYEPAQLGTVYLIGKVKDEGKWVSACVAVKHIKHCLFVVPKPFVFCDPDGEIDGLEQAAKDEVQQNTASEGKSTATPAKRALMSYLQSRCEDLKQELRERLSRQCSEISIVPVMRDYAFDDDRVPLGKQWVLKVRCNAAPGSIPSDLSGKHFSAVLGTNQTPLEALLVKRGIMGPSWITLHHAVPVDTQVQVSWCKKEFSVPSPKMVVASSTTNVLPPPLTVAAVNIKVVSNGADKVNQVMSVSIVYAHNIRMDVQTDTARWKECRGIKHFSVLRKIDATSWPLGLQNLVKAANDKGKDADGDVLCAQGSERALLAYFLVRLNKLDPDVIVGHNIGNWDVSILLQRMQHHKVPHWSRMGRFKRNKMPHLSGGGNVYGGGASQGVMTCLAGRLLVDTYVVGRELLKEVEYSLASLASKFLKEQRIELQPAQVRGMCETASEFMQLVGHGESDAWLAMGLMFYLSIIPLSLQLSNISGFLWARTLQGNRAQRIEMLLLHEFHRRKFLLPNKPERFSKPDTKKALKAVKPAAKAVKPAVEGEDADAGNDDDPESEPQVVEAAVAKSKGPQYAGGLVLEPKKGLYSKYVLLLDFNSLYPSIIQEYNICFTTVQRPAGDTVPALPQNTSELAPLPFVIQGLVNRRKQVKAAMKMCKDPVKLRQLDIRQQAIKLTANSMYGCLGFGASRFYAKPLAQLITSQGREILQNTVELVQSNMGLDVIYGDTDSIMIYTGSNDMAHVLSLGQQVKKLVNKHYQLLEIDLDGVFKTMLLLKKKKYAAVKMDPGPTPGSVVETLETKGLDIVRRDWCQLSRDVGQFCLQQILSGNEVEDVTSMLHEHLRSVAAQMKSGQIVLDKFVITKQLTKRIEDYPDAKTQAHVKVAMRSRDAGLREGTQAGDVIRYVICTNLDDSTESASSGKGLADRAYHPRDLATNENLQIDIMYYLAHQLHPVVSRLCATMDTTNEARIAECLGLDTARFRHVTHSTGAAFSEESLMGGGPLLDDDDRYATCDPLTLKSPKGSAFPLPSLASIVEESTPVDTLFTPSAATHGSSDQLHHAQLSNQAVLAARRVMRQYYDAELRSDDDSVPSHSRDLTLCEVSTKAGPCTPGTCALDPDCTGHMAPCLSEPAAYLQLSHLARQLDVQRLMDRVDPETRQKVHAHLAPAMPLLDGALTSVQRYVSSASYHWVRMPDYFSKLTC